MMFLAGLYAAEHRPSARQITAAALIEAAAHPPGPLPYNREPQLALDAWPSTPTRGPR
ncbi:MAG: hypothetical protein R3D85_13190 [Paracoccaceae bacterium]